MIKTKQKQELFDFLKSKIGVKVMLTVKVDIHGCLIKGETRNIGHAEFAQDYTLEVYVKFSREQAAL